MSYITSVECSQNEETFFSKISDIIAEDGRERDGWKRSVSYHPGDGDLDKAHYTVAAASEAILAETLDAIASKLSAKTEINSEEHA